MKFGPVPVAEALGAVLAHSVQVADGRLRKGVTIGPKELARLMVSGHAQVIVARLEPGDLHENDAAAQLAKAVAGPGLRLTKAATGRVNIIATGPGIACIAVEAINAVNAVNPMITVATVPPHHRVDCGGMVATIKIISYAVPADDLQKACAIGSDLLALACPIHRSATLIETRLAPMPAAKGRAAIQARLDRLGLSLTPPVIVDHTASALARAITDSPGDLVLILTASATSDSDDVGPAALRMAGGRLVQFGMPVDPGNLLFLGKAGHRPVIGLPGCARSAALNGADWVMERVICGIDLSPADFAVMGVGGLLKEIPQRPQPRSSIGD
ncbi:molybdopterin-binding protein [Yoonia sp.]|uniref:molybdopterin-binding protein n=1 Tax=Yoonia sp. TaxID=2212373 RepID=UPI0019D93AF5|nr:molybdopterin-binding protein [Yoonia sp.]MBE0413018.1 molybdopterin-binding protein [Yoonia sp.]